jgi:hypothetical protein
VSSSIKYIPFRTQGSLIVRQTCFFGLKLDYSKGQSKHSPLARGHVFACRNPGLSLWILQPVFRPTRFSQKRRTILENLARISSSENPESAKRVRECFPDYQDLSWGRKVCTSFCGCGATMAGGEVLSAVIVGRGALRKIPSQSPRVVAPLGETSRSSLECKFGE